MRKLLALILCICMLFTFAACGPKPAEPSGGSDDPGTDEPTGGDPGEVSEAGYFSLGTEYTVNDFVKVALIKVETTDKAYASHQGRLYEGKGTFVDAVLAWDNISADEQYSDDMVVFTATDPSGREYSDAAVYIEDMDSGDRPTSNVVAWGSVASKDSTRLHCIVPVESGMNNLTLRFVIQNQAYCYDYTVGEECTAAKTLRVGDSIEASGKARLVFNGIDYTRMLNPSDTSSSYYSIGVQGPNSENNTFFVAKFTLTNLKQEEVDVQQIVNMGVRYDDGVTYCCGPYDEGGEVETSFDGIPGFDNAIGALESKPFFFLIQVPKDNVEMGFTLTVILGGKDYVYKASANEIVPAKETAPALSAETLKAGATVSFGKYEQDNVTENGAEPIEWLVLGAEDGCYLLISKFALEEKPFYSEYKDAMWEDSVIRIWLNGTFKETAFSADEQALIQTKLIPAEVGNNSKLSYGSDTFDDVFLLSTKEAQYYFPTDDERLCGGTEYVIKTGEALANDRKLVDGRPAVYWWLRNHSDNPCASGAVSEEGTCIAGTVTNNHWCIRPAIWVKVN